LWIGIHGGLAAIVANRFTTRRRLRLIALRCGGGGVAQFRQSASLNSSLLPSAVARVYRPSAPSAGMGWPSVSCGYPNWSAGL
jgi:hypothetical protein